MRKTALTLIVILSAMLARPLQLPAASCILVNAPSAEGCKPKCCANKTCCAASKKSSAPVTPPLYKSSDVNQSLVIGFVSVPTFDSSVVVAASQVAWASVPVRAHSPPPLAATCIRLI
jgi:hypothetical protein